MQKSFFLPICQSSGISPLQNPPSLQLSLLHPLFYSILLQLIVLCIDATQCRILQYGANKVSFRDASYFWNSLSAPSNEMPATVFWHHSCLQQNVKGDLCFFTKSWNPPPNPSRGQRYIGKKLSNADKLALVKLSAKLSISKNWNFEIIEKLSISENASNLVR